MGLILVAGPAVEPVTQAETWDHLRVDLSGSPAVPADSGHIDVLIQAAREHLDGRDGWLGRALITQTWDLKLDKFPTVDYIPLPLPPIQSITSIKYIDTDGVEQTFTSDDYSLSGDKDHRPRVNLGFNKTWPTPRDQPEAVTVRYVAGYGDTAASVPFPIKAAMLLMIAQLYEHREEVIMGGFTPQVSRSVDALLAPYRAGLFS